MNSIINHKNIMSKKYKALFVDLDDTLFDSHSLYDQAVHMSWEHFRKFYDVEFKDYLETFLKIRSELKDQFKFKTISHHRAILFERLLEHFQIPFDADLILDLYNTYWFAVNTYIQPFPSVINTLTSIKKAHIKIVALSDGTVLSRLQKIQALKISPLIDLLVSSEETNFTKPKPDMFKLALQKADVEKDEVIFVGNSYSADVTGGDDFGITTVWFNPNKMHKPRNSDFAPDFVIKEFKEILGIMGIVS